MLLYKVVCGSHLYGLNTPTSDLDYGMVYLESQDQIYGIDSANPLPQIVTETEDQNRHWLRNFAHLCKKGNPNAIEWLWAPKDKILEVDPLFETLILTNASAFLGLKGLTASHFGFAKSQITKMRVADGQEGKGKPGKARRDLVTKWGYDTKYASHAARLMFQLQQIVNTGVVVYPFTGDNYKTIMEIKTGEVPNNEIDSLLEQIKARCESDVQNNLAKVPESGNAEKINQILVEFFQTKFRSIS